MDLQLHTKSKKSLSCPHFPSYTFEEKPLKAPEEIAFQMPAHFGSIQNECKNIHQLPTK
jgi:hypothetical protein